MTDISMTVCPACQGHKKVCGVFCEMLDGAQIIRDDDFNVFLGYHPCKDKGLTTFDFDGVVDTQYTCGGPAICDAGIPCPICGEMGEVPVDVGTLYTLAESLVPIYRDQEDGTPRQELIRDAIYCLVEACSPKRNQACADLRIGDFLFLSYLGHSDEWCDFYHLLSGIESGNWNALGPDRHRVVRRVVQEITGIIDTVDKNLSPEDHSHYLIVPVTMVEGWLIGLRILASYDIGAASELDKVIRSLLSEGDE